MLAGAPHVSVDGVLAVVVNVQSGPSVVPPLLCETVRQ
jgi:hypothetical protein